MSPKGVVDTTCALVCWDPMDFRFLHLENLVAIPTSETDTTTLHVTGRVADDNPFSHPVYDDPLFTLFSL